MNNLSNDVTSAMNHLFRLSRTAPMNSGPVAEQLTNTMYYPINNAMDHLRGASDYART